jgi:hypothetical protein
MKPKWRIGIKIGECHSELFYKGFGKNVKILYNNPGKC